MAKVPLTLLTGFLGAGKTTAVNRLLGARAGKRVAVLVNDLGRVNVDRALIEREGGDVLELSGGCVCCAVNVQRDLWEGIIDIVDRAAPDALLLETTGIAEPHVVLDRLRDADGPRERVIPAGLICVVDAQAGADTLRERPEARAQVACADRILVSKLDRASAREARSVHDAIREHNADAEVAAFPLGDADASRRLADYLLAVRPLHPNALRWTGDDAALRPVPQNRTNRSHLHDHGQLEVVTFVDEAPLLPSVLLDALARFGPRLVRAKGFVRLAEPPGYAFLEKAGVEPVTLAPEPPSQRGPPARTEIVLIGEGLDEAEVARALWACAVRSGVSG
jgi:G3E family GTPase